MFNSVAEVMNKRGLTPSVLKEWEEKEYFVSGLSDVALRIEDAISKNIPIHIIGDYDVDGIMATAIIYLAITQRGYKNVTTRLPKRFSEGYGLSTKIIDEIESGLIITVDNGIAAIDAVKKAKEKGLTVLVIDHHLPSPDGFPDADIIIDPNAIPEQSNWNGYCGAGLAYKFVELFSKSEELKDKLLSLACIATIADSVPLLEDNRNIVRNGLKKMTQKGGVTEGLRLLMLKKNLSSHITEEDIAFIVAPCLNAPGRLIDDGANLSLKLVISGYNYNVLDKIADSIINSNEERKRQTETIMLKLESKIENDGLDKHGVLIVQDDYISDGLLGLCAGRLAEKYKMPTIVFGVMAGGYYKGSVRSYGNFNIKEFLDLIAEILKGKDVIRQYGGHAAAAGISIFDGKLEDFQKQIYAQNVSVPEILIEPDISCKNYDIKKYINEIKAYAPFGQGNEKIVFNISDFVCEPIRNKMYAILKEKHLKLKSTYSEAMWFGEAEKYEKMNFPRRINIMGYLSESYFNGQFTPSIEIIDIATVPKRENAFLTQLKKYAEEK